MLVVETCSPVTNQSGPGHLGPPWEVLLRRIQWSQACWGHCGPSSCHSSRRIIQPRPGKNDVLNCRHSMLDVTIEPCSWLSTAMRVGQGAVPLTVNCAGLCCIRVGEAAAPLQLYPCAKCVCKSGQPYNSSAQSCTTMLPTP